LRELAEGAAPLLLVGSSLGEITERDDEESKGAESARLVEVLEKRDEELLGILRRATVPKGALIGVEKYLREDRQLRRPAAGEGALLRLSAESSASLRTLIHAELPQLRERVRSLLDALQSARQRLDQTDRLLAGVPDAESIARLVSAQDEARRREEAARTRS